MTIKIRALLVAVMIATTIWLAGCGHYVCTAGFGDTTCNNTGTGTGTSGGNGATQTAFMYFMDDAAGQMAAVGLDVANSHTFEPIANWVPPPVVEKNSIDGGLVVVNKTYLYMTISSFPGLSTGGVYGYSINGTTGALTAIPNTPLNLSLPPYYASPITADPGGKFLFVGDSAGIYVLAINANDGSLTSSGPFTAGIGQPVNMATDGTGKYLYAMDGTNIAQFSYSSSGTLTSLGTVPSGMMMMTGEATGKYMIGITQHNGAHGAALDSNVYVFTISASGALAQLPPFSTSGDPSYVQVSPNGDYLYTFNEDDQSTGATFLQPVQGFSLSGLPSTLTPLTSSPFTGFLSAVGKIDQSGQYMFILGQESDVADAGALAVQISSAGGLSTTLPQTGSASTSIAVTDAP